jgi:hypothetical protein
LEPPIFATLAFCSILTGIMLASRHRRAPARSLRLAGVVFVLGFVFLGVAIGRWDVE